MARILMVAALFGTGLTLTTFSANSASAAEPTVGLGTAANFAVLAGSTVTNTGPSVLEGFDLGVSPGSAVTGFPPGQVTAPGVAHQADATALQAQSDATTAFNDAAGRSPAPADSGLTDLGGKTLQPGVYQGDALSLTGTVTLNNNDVPDAVFIFQSSSTLIMSSSSVVTFTNADHPSCNVFWKVGSSAVIGTGSSFVGTLLAQISVSAATSATVQGRLLAKVGAVTLDNNTITRLRCGPVIQAPVTTQAPATTATPGVTATPGTTVPPAVTPTSAVVVVPPAVATATPTTPTTRAGTSGAATVTAASTVTPAAGTAGSRTSTSSTSSASSAKTTGGGSTGAITSSGQLTYSTRSNRTMSTRTSSGTTGLALTGPPPIGGLLIVAFTVIFAGGALLALVRPRRIRTGRHHRPAH